MINNLPSLLIVDDSPDNIELIVALLKDSYIIKVATNGARALTLATGPNRPDLILLDVVMPGMNGYEVCKKLKLNPLTAAIPIIFLTALTEIDDETLGFEAGAVDYIHKPFSPSIVRARVRTHISLARASALEKNQQTTLANAYHFLSLREMARGLASEINQPLTAIINYANSGTRKLDNDKFSPEIMRSLLEKTASQALRAATVIRRLRNLLERAPLGRELSNINTLILEALKITQEAARGYVKIRAVFGRNLPAIQVDNFQLIQAVVNLIFNAIESMKRSSLITSRLIIATSIKTEGELEVAFRDNSKIIFDEITAIMNDPFFSTHYSTIRMGLPVTRAIIEEHGGKLWAAPNRLRGMTMRFTIPAAVAAAAVG